MRVRSPFWATNNFWRKQFFRYCRRISGLYWGCSAGDPQRPIRHGLYQCRVGSTWAGVAFRSRGRTLVMARRKFPGTGKSKRYVAVLKLTTATVIFTAHWLTPIFWHRSILNYWVDASQTCHWSLKTGWRQRTRKALDQQRRPLCCRQTQANFQGHMHQAMKNSSRMRHCLIGLKTRSGFVRPTL